jgi:capsule polysaccharide export protein KpsC/LpsZ
LFDDYGEWFVETVRAACSNPSMNWLVKMHPANMWKRSYENVTLEYTETMLIRREIGVLPPHVRLIGADDDISTLSLFKAIDFGVTVRGTSGMELVCFGKPCVTAGTGRYSGLGFTLDCADRQQYLDRLASLHKQPPLTAQEVLQAKWHAYTSFLLRPWAMKSVRAKFIYGKRHHALDHNLHLTVSSTQEMEASSDLISFADWAQSSRVDFLSQHTFLP